MPIRERSFGESVFGRRRRCRRPYFALLERLQSVHAFDQRRFSAPDGPHTTRLRLFHFVEAIVRTWKPPYHLLTFLIEIMDPT